MLHVRGLRRPGLGPIDLSLAAGECVALSGPSGAGKSLLLRAIADLDPSDGAVSLDGTARESVAAPAWRRRVTYVAAESAWWADRVGAHFADAAAAHPIVQGLGLPAAALDWPVARLSTGERQRLALARALALAPPVLLLDEPTAALDPEATAAVETALRDRLDNGCAILMVTHDAAQAGRLAGRRFRVADGKLHQARP